MRDRPLGHFRADMFRTVCEKLLKNSEVVRRTRARVTTAGTRDGQSSAATPARPRLRAGVARWPGVRESGCVDDAFLPAPTTGDQATCIAADAASVVPDGGEIRARGEVAIHGINPAAADLARQHDAIGGTEFRARWPNRRRRIGSAGARRFPREARRWFAPISRVASEWSATPVGAMRGFLVSDGTRSAARTECRASCRNDCRVMRS